MLGFAFFGPVFDADLAFILCPVMIWLAVGILAYWPSDLYGQGRDEGGAL